MISITLISGTLAYYIWQSSDEQKTNVVFSVEKFANYSCSADGGGKTTAGTANTGGGGGGGFGGSSGGSGIVIIRNKR